MVKLDGLRGLVVHFDVVGPPRGQDMKKLKGQRADPGWIHWRQDIDMAYKHFVTVKAQRRNKMS